MSRFGARLVKMSRGLDGTRDIAGSLFRRPEAVVRACQEFLPIQCDPGKSPSPLYKVCIGTAGPTVRFGRRRRMCRGAQWVGESVRIPSEAFVSRSHILVQRIISVNVNDTVHMLEFP